MIPVAFGRRAPRRPGRGRPRRDLPRAADPALGRPRAAPGDRRLGRRGHRGAPLRPLARSRGRAAHRAGRSARPAPSAPPAHRAGPRTASCRPRRDRVGAQDRLGPLGAEHAVARPRSPVVGHPRRRSPAAPGPSPRSRRRRRDRERSEAPLELGPERGGPRGARGRRPTSAGAPPRPGPAARAITSPPAPLAGRGGRRRRRRRSLLGDRSGGSPLVSPSPAISPSSIARSAAAAAPIVAGNDPGEVGLPDGR